jgi:pyruvate dehydrogenase E1 component
MVDDIDPQETREWLDAMEALIQHGGRERAAFMLFTLAAKAYEKGLKLPTAITTPYRNTIHFTEEKRMSGDLFMERRIRSLVRWNATGDGDARQQARRRSWRPYCHIFVGCDVV